MKLFAAGALGLGLLLSGCQSVDLTPTSGRTIATTEVTSKGVIFKAGDKVKISSRAGTFKRADTRHTADVEAGPGQAGIFLGAVQNSDGGASQVALVRFPAQTWRDGSAGADVELQEFEATIHSDYLVKR